MFLFKINEHLFAIAFINRCDGRSYMFLSCMLNLELNRWYGQFLSHDRYSIGCLIFMYAGTNMENKMREAVMFKLGSSAGASKFPKFKNPRNNGKTSMLPRLIVKCRPGQIGNLFMKNCAWFKYLV